LKNEAKILSGTPSEEGSAASEILSGLNAAQREVALHGEGPLLVLAVAGSGKTRAIAHRVAHLVVGRQVPPSEMLCLTFTNKAAGEMRERIGRLLGGPPAGLTVATFHGLCAKLLRVHHSLISRSHRFSIYDDEDASRVIRETAKELKAEGIWEALRSDIDRLKNHGALPNDDLVSILALRDPEDRTLTLLREAYSRYEQKLARYDALDFNDLLFKAVLLLTRHPEILSHLRRRCRHLLVDEYQDTAPLQERLLSRTGYEAYLAKSCPDAPRRISRVMQLVGIAGRFEQDHEGGLPEFLLQAGLSAAGPEGEGRSDQVRLMTIHAAKGLEFKTVFVIGLEEGVLPHARCRDNLEEERRLFYVAVTRARERLFLSWSTRRTIQGREMNLSLSSLMKELHPRRERWGKAAAFIP